jgi:hypothetical protein
MTVEEQNKLKEWWSKLTTQEKDYFARHTFGEKTSYKKLSIEQINKIYHGK